MKCLESSKSVLCVCVRLVFSERRCCDAAAGILEMRGHTRPSCQTGSPSAGRGTRWRLIVFLLAIAGRRRLKSAAAAGLRTIERT